MLRYHGRPDRAVNFIAFHAAPRRSIDTGYITYRYIIEADNAKAVLAIENRKTPICNVRVAQDRGPPLNAAPARDMSPYHSPAAAIEMLIGGLPF
jgi:hypothetical protein